ncbi:exodeoxyribonuclease VII small subunit [Aquisediminimonas sediminicola]|uniref:exodeoxyribonuclease VII small subunit n=1 Tax=Alteraquisediminimonas sediminicola TaxID=2676787 RepID=UPI001C8E6121|nr:exodeoxyribonuclease VII small subunit [Aquisediminimonas sediminicola]
MAQDTDMTGKSFEDALRELETVVGKLERGDVPLEESLALYARGDQLRLHCEARLREAQARIEQITLNNVGAPAGTVPFDGA